MYTGELIMHHIDQLAATFAANIDVIYVLQAGFIGAWGESHDSATHIKDNYTATSAIVERLLFSGMLPADRKINVRMPQYKILRVLRDSDGNVGSPPYWRPPLRPSLKMARGIVTAATTRSDTAVARIGFDNDGFMSDASDGGSWMHTGDQDPNRKAPVCPAVDGGGPVSGSLGSPTQGSAHGFFTDLDYGYAVRESPFVPVDGEMYWNLGGGKGYAPLPPPGRAPFPHHIAGATASWRFREMHYTTLSLVHGFSQLDGCPAV